MSRLVPTPRTDKNGRTVIRHMKPKGSGSSSALGSVVPALKGSNNSDLMKMTAAQFLDYMYPNDVGISNYSGKHLEMIEGLHPDSRETLVFLMGKGNDEAFERVREHYKEGLATLLFNEVKRRSVRPRIKDMYYATNTLEETIIQTWAIGSLCSEGGEHVESKIEPATYSESNRMHRVITVTDDTRDYQRDTDYWRAVAAAVILTPEFESKDSLDFEDDEIAEMRELVSWLETQESLGDVVRIAAERGLSKRSDIEELLQNSGVPSLSSGAL